MTMDATRARANSARAREAIRALLMEMDLDPSEERLPAGVALHVELDGPADQGIAQILSNAERFVFHFIFPGYVQESRRAKVAEFITRANWGQIEGNFELNFDTGVVRYKTGIDFSSTELTAPLIRNAILAGMENIEIWARGLERVADGSVEPAQAYEEAAAGLKPR